MNTTEVEEAIRRALRDDSAYVTVAEHTEQSPGKGTLRAGGSHRLRRWGAPLLVAAAVIAVAGIAVKLGSGHGDDSRDVAARPHTASVSDAVTGPGIRRSGTWRLVSATVGTQSVPVPAGSKVTVIFAKDALRVNDGINVTVISVVSETATQLRGRFRSVTYVLDPRQEDRNWKPILQLLDSLAPSSDPSSVATSRLTTRRDELSIETASGTLTLQKST